MESPVTSPAELIDDMVPIVIGGVSYKVGGLSQTIQEAFKRYMLIEVSKWVNEEKVNKLLEDRYDKFLQQFMLDKRLGKYDFNSEFFWDFIMMGKWPNEHLVELFWYCFSKYQQFPKSEMKALMEKHGEEFTALFKVLMLSKKD